MGSSQQAGRHIDDREGLHEDNFGYLSKKFVQYKMQKEKALCCIHGFFFGGGVRQKKS